MNLFEELENAIRQRGVRVEERLVLFKALRDVHEAGGDAGDMLRLREEELLNTVSDAANGVIGKVIG